MPTMLREHRDAPGRSMKQLQVDNLLAVSHSPTFGNMTEYTEGHVYMYPFLNMNTSCDSPFLTPTEQLKCSSRVNARGQMVMNAPADTISDPVHQICNPLSRQRNFAWLQSQERRCTGLLKAKRFERQNRAKKVRWSNPTHFASISGYFTDSYSSILISLLPVFTVFLSDPSVAVAGKG